MDLISHSNKASLDIDLESNTQHTDAEIQRQPYTWKKVLAYIKREEKKIDEFLTNILSINSLNIILSGAGSSAFIGDAVALTWQKETGVPTQAIPTTDLVTHFEKKVETSEPLLLVSFARSGNSPESTATIERANELCEQVYHLIITCNKGGKLAQMNSRDNNYVFLLPAEAEDQSLAMTNSFTSMALAATVIPMLKSKSFESLSEQINLLASYGENIIQKYNSLLYQVAELDFERIIFLGSGPSWGIAKESHLKVQELTNGQVIGKYDSFLGFRHGPKAIINSKTLLVYLLSNNENTRRYEKDLIDQISQHNIKLKTFSLSETELKNSGIDFSIALSKSNELWESFWAILCTLPAQIIGFYKSLMIGLNPDAPSPDGTISRVVEGVTIYDDGYKELSV